MGGYIIWIIIFFIIQIFVSQAISLFVPSLIGSMIISDILIAFILAFILFYPRVKRKMMSWLDFINYASVIALVYILLSLLQIVLF